MKTNHIFLASYFNTTLKTAFLSIFFVFLFAENLAAQCKPMIKIDGDNTVVSANDEYGLALPFWLKANQTLAVGSSVSKISVLEFDVVNGNTLEFSQVVIVTSTSPVTVPVGTVWKIESVAKENNPSIYNRSATFSAAETFTWTVPACAEKICIDLWGAGGGGGGYGPYSNYYPGGGGGGGAFGSQCFIVTPSTTYTITVGKGGTGGNGTVDGTAGTESKVVDISSVTIISARGGAGGSKGTSSAGGTGGAGGSSTASTNASGGKGLDGAGSTGGIGGGGAGANGGAGGIGAFYSSSSPTAADMGKSPGGGGGGGARGIIGGSGADGKVIISW